jgi:P27 family predicted phage terminase small subunit
MPRKKSNSAQQNFPVVAEEKPAPVEKVECPPELGVIARAEWDRVAPHLSAAGRLEPLDRSSLAVYCAAYASWLEATIALQTYGTVMKSPNGYPLQSPYVSIATKYADIMARIAAEFGFTPASRRRFPSGSADPYMLELLNMATPVE